MTTTTTKPKRGLILRRGGAPATWHTLMVPDPDGGPMLPVPGVFHPETIMPLHVLGIDDAEAARIVELTTDGDGHAALELVDITSDVKATEDAAQLALQTGGRGALREARSARRGEPNTRSARAERIATARTAAGVADVETPPDQERPAEGEGETAEGGDSQ